MNTQENLNQKGKSHHLSTGLGLAVAMALGATLGVLFGTKEGVETQKDVAEKAQELAKKFKKTKDEMQETLQNIFGDVTKEIEENYLELKGHILATVDEIQDKTSLTQKKYNEIVKDAVNSFAKGKKWSEKAVHNLIKELQKDWE